MSRWVTGAGLLLGLLLDQVWADPRRGHPVAGFGLVAARVERALYADRRGPGIAYVVALVGVPTLVAAHLERRVRTRPVAHLALLAGTSWAVLGGRSLRREATVMGELLAGPDLAQARARLSHLCARDATDLGVGELARASVESVAENTSDAIVGPLVWGALAGVPGLVAFRAANTLDAMVGYRSARHQRFGWAAARLDDLLCLLPARLTALLVVLAAPTVGGRPRDALSVWQRDAGGHPSPNAGPVEAAVAGALGIRLGGSSTYRGDHGRGTERRGVLGDGRGAAAHDIPRVARLSAVVTGLAGGLCAVLAYAVGTRRAGR